MRIQGQWENGNVNHGEWIFPNGKVYRGAFKNNKPDGNGTNFYSR